MSDKSLLEIFEYFYILEDVVKVEKYSFHWQDAEGNLISRWDNAKHHPNIATYPNHVHKNIEDKVYPHKAVDVKAILDIIEMQLSERDR